jgi:hypothetical protein
MGLAFAKKILVRSEEWQTNAKPVRGVNDLDECK